jgi:hypothetical protein
VRRGEAGSHQAAKPEINQRFALCENGTDFGKMIVNRLLPGSRMPCDTMQTTILTVLYMDGCIDIRYQMYCICRMHMTSAWHRSCPDTDDTVLANLHAVLAHK